jgi:hypothetical protein
MPDATIVQFPRRKMRPDMRAIVHGGNDRLLQLACLSMVLAEDARQRPAARRADGNALTPAFLCAGIILGAIDRDEFRFE